jgi:predicted alpha/beta-hydrolase family hydrolase
MRLRAANLLLAILGVGLCIASLWSLSRAKEGLSIEAASIEGTPATVFRPATDKPLAAVVVAHGFAGSQQLMQAFATTVARNGYVAVTFDFLGHGRNPAPLGGSITEVEGATRALVDQTSAVVAHAKGLGDGRVAVLGHSMASDIVVRAAAADPDITATIAVSMFSPAVTATVPKNLLVIVGGLEGMLKEEALRAIGLAIAPQAATPGVTYGDFGAGTARRAAFSDSVEHVGVLYSRASMAEALGWLDQSFGVQRAADPYLDGRGPWIMALPIGVVLLARPLSALLPQARERPAGGGMPWRRFWIVLLVPTIATPLLLRVLPTHFLPVLVGDYLAVHFFMFGLLTALCLALVGRGRAVEGHDRTAPGAFGIATAAAVGFGFIGLVWPIDSYVTSFVPGPARGVLIAAMLAGTLMYFLADEWSTRGAARARFAYPAAKIAFLLSLAGAVALDFERLFFLMIIIPVIVPFFLVHGLFSRWIYQATRHPLVAAIANAVAFAWAIGVTFPLLAG